MALVIPLADLRSPLERSYRNTYYCAGLLEQHVNGRITAKYCNNRWCLVCLRVRTGRAINRYEPILLPWEGRQFVTLTVPNVRSDVLQTTIKELVRSSMTIARGIRRSDNLPFKALRKVECTYNPRTDTFHPHLHLIVDGFAPSERLVKRWLKAYPDASPRAQDIRACDPSQLRELFKYFTKLACSRGTGDKGWLPPSVLDTIFMAMRNRRVYQPMGFVGEIATTDEEADVGIDDVTYAWTRRGEYVRWKWSQDLHDWLDDATGDLLTTTASPLECDI